MKIAKITFKKLVQDSQEYGSDDEHMVSRAYFSIEIEGSKYNNVYVDIKQPVGSDFESTLLEVSMPYGYNGPFNYEAFIDATESYYGSLVGSYGSGIEIQSGRNIRMQENTFIKSAHFEMQVTS